MTLTTKTYDFEVGDAWAVGAKNVVSAGGNIRRNDFTITLAPAAQDRNEFGAYVQDEIFLNHVRLNIGEANTYRRDVAGSVARRLRRHAAPQRESWKLEKYRRGPLVTKDAAAFLASVRA